jgi:plasmid stabilization system protein ParE
MDKVIWSKRASGQLERNVKYIKDEHGVSYAETVLNKILSSTALLGSDDPPIIRTGLARF